MGASSKKCKHLNRNRSNTLELPKLPQDGDGTPLWDWLRFVGARRKEELDMLAEKNPQVGKAVAKLVELNADERARLIADSREKLRRDTASQLRSARMEGREEGLEEGRKEIARKLLDAGMPAENVAQITELSRETIQTLRR